MNSKKTLGVVIVAVAMLLIYTQLTFFVIQPLGLYRRAAPWLFYGAKRRNSSIVPMLFAKESKEE